MTDTTNLPVLKILPTTALTPHEDCDPRRVERLARRLREEGRLKHPPVVAHISGTERYVVLDGANRSMSLAHIGAPHAIAQVVSYGDPGIKLETWHHVVAGMPLPTFEAGLEQATHLVLEECTLDDARAALATDVAAAYIVSESGVRMARKPLQTPLHDIRLLHTIVDVYRGRADIFRASNDDWEKQKPYYPNITSLVVFPRFKPADILNAARNGEKVPSGITRHIIPFRALNINIPLSVLESPEPLEWKEQWLHGWWMERMAANAIRYYAEPTFSFDE